MSLMIGTSGWQYRDWRGDFYPAGVPVSRWLEYYAEHFPVVENNGTFYRLASRDTFAGWQERTPAGFVMAIKASRYLTHIRRLRDPAEPVARLLSAAGGSATGSARCCSNCRRPCRPIPPRSLNACASSRRSSPGDAAACAAALRVCVEFRHPSWLTATSGRS